MKHSLQMSETLRLGIILALSGGFMDAYSYLNGETYSQTPKPEICSYSV